MRKRNQEEHRPTLPGYEVLERIGKGGMGEVYSATKVGPAGFRKELAIKRLRVGRTSEEAVQRFLREARVSAALDHPNIVHVHDLIEDSGDYFMVMERLRGLDLRAALRASKKAPPLGIVVEIGCQVLQGLGEAHALADENGRSLGLVHRDLTPRNIFVCRSGAVKVLDFGVARLRFVGQDRHLTRDGQTLGTLPYLPPEVQLGHQPDSRSDLYQVGLLLYLMLTGERPVVKRDGVKAPRLGELDAPIRAVVSRALTMDPRDRYGDAELMHDELRGVSPTPGRKTLAKWLKVLEGGDELGLPEAVKLPSVPPPSPMSVPKRIAPSVPPPQVVSRAPLPAPSEVVASGAAPNAASPASASPAGETSSETESTAGAESQSSSGVSSSGMSSLSMAQGPPISQHPPALLLGKDMPTAAPRSAAAAVLRRDSEPAPVAPSADDADPTVMAMRPDFLAESHNPDDVETADAIGEQALLPEPAQERAPVRVFTIPPPASAAPALEPLPAPAPTPESAAPAFTTPEPTEKSGVPSWLWMGVAVVAAVMIGVALAIATAP